MNTIPPELLARVASALQKLTNASSQNLGGDCIAHAYLAQNLLLEQGHITQLAFGVAAWRLGPGDADVIVHSPQVAGYAQVGTPSIAFHCWLEALGTIYDFSTHTLRMKAEQLDSLDGAHTTVDWCPPFLAIAKADTLPLREVAQAMTSGVAFYEEVFGLYEFLDEKGMIQDRDKESEILLSAIFKNPNIEVFGPNHSNLVQPKGFVLVPAIEASKEGATQ